MIIDFKIQAFNPVKRVILDFFSPVINTVHKPIGYFHNVSNYLQSHNKLIAKNAQLQQDLRLLQIKLLKYNALEVENNNLHSLLNSVPNSNINYMVANIINIDSDPFTHQVILDKGVKNGVFEGQQVLDAYGIFGTVIFVSDTKSKVMLVSDASFSIPVENIRTGMRAIANGSSVINVLDLKHVPNTANIEVGDLWVTSGLGGKFKYGLPVGKVTAVVNDLTEPFAKISLTANSKLDKSRQVVLIINKDD